MSSDLLQSLKTLNRNELMSERKIKKFLEEARHDYSTRRGSHKPHDEQLHSKAMELIFPPSLFNQ